MDVRGIQMSLAKKAAKSAVIIMLITIISKVFGFLREVIIAAYYGAGIDTDAYFMAQGIPSVLFASIGVSLTTTFIPIYTEYLVLKGEEEANKFSTNIVNIVILVSLLFSILGIFFTPYIVKILAPGFKGELLVLTIKLTKIMFPMLLFVTLANIFTGILQTRHQFVIPSLVGIPFSIIIIIGSLLLSVRYGIYALTWATVLAYVSQVLIQLPALKNKYKYACILNFKDKGVQKLYILMLPVLIGTAVQQINTLIDKIFASRLDVGSVSAINYAGRLIGFVYGIFITSIAVVIYPLFSELSAKDNYSELRKLIARSVVLIMLIVLPITAGTVLLREDIVKLVFERGAFDTQATHLTSYALAFYILALAPFGTREILNRAFYSLKDTKTPMINGTIAVVINIMLNIILVNFLGIGGLGLATATSALVGTTMLLYSLKKKLGLIKIKSMFFELVKILAASLLMVFVVFLLNNMISLPNIYFRLCINILVGMVSYAVFIYFFRVEELKWLLQLAKQYINKLD
jgi:putative peptidoglycan lipid II flippase